MVSSITILGSTGSIGVQTLDVCRRYGIKVEGLAVAGKVEQLLLQIKEFQPPVVAVADKCAAEKLKHELKKEGLNTTVLEGPQAAAKLAQKTTAETVMCAMVGIAGLEPVVRALETGHQIALANKESLVAGGRLVMGLARNKGILIRPVDSEHSAIWQCLRSGSEKELRRIWLTASGGPFRTFRRDEMLSVTPEQALKHPTWDMGAKISIDSATMMNKGLELIEACWLFDIKPEQIEYLVHPQSIIHSMVEWQDGSVIAQLGDADMRLPIQLALTYPDRLSEPERSFNPFTDNTSTLVFEQADYERFPCLRLAREAMDAGGLLPTVLNAANEVAVAAFLKREISFMDISGLIAATMQEIQGNGTDDNLEDILQTDREARLVAASLISRITN